LQLKVFQRPADLIEDRVDIALRGRTQIETDAIIARPLGRTRLVLVMSPELLTACAGNLTVERLANCPTLSNVENVDDDCWELVGPNGETHVLRHQPRLFCSNWEMLRTAAIAGLGVALLPEQVCWPSFQSGELKHVLPDWHTRDYIIHAVFMSRKGMLPSVRAFIDYLVCEVPKIGAVRPAGLKTADT
jgi:DNA-binding transcriptional LysR family regulator